MDCVVTTATLHEDVLDLVASADGSEMRFLMPKHVLEWTAGQRFSCSAVDHDEKSGAAGAAGAAEAITLRGEVVERDATATLLSFGGLPMRLPPSFQLGSETAVVLRLVPYVESRKRPLRPRPDGAAERAT